MALWIVSSSGVSIELFKGVPHYLQSRQNGWIVTNLYADIERFAEGIRYRNHGLEQGQLELLTNGHMTYAILIGETFYHRQAPEEAQRQPRIWPLAVIEYPLSFMKLYRAICDLSHLNGPFHAHVEYLHIAGHILPAGVPTLFGFLGLRHPDPFAQDRLSFTMDAPTNFNPDLVTYDLVRQIYAAFGHSPGDIPFWDQEARRFHLPP